MVLGYVTVLSLQDDMGIFVSYIKIISVILQIFENSVCAALCICLSAGPTNLLQDLMKIDCSWWADYQFLIAGKPRFKTKTNLKWFEIVYKNIWHPQIVYQVQVDGNQTVSFREFTEIEKMLTI